MPGAISLTGLSANDPVPGAYLEINFAQGDAAGSGSPIEVLLMGNMLSTGSATADTVVYGPDSIVQLQTEQDAIDLFGAGSELHRMFRRFTKVNRDTTLRAIAVTESAGNQATGTYRYVGTATAAGNTRLYVHDEFVDVPIDNLATASEVATDVADEVNKQTHWGVQATATATGTWGFVTITAKQKGPRGNDIRFMPQIDPGIGMSLPTAVDRALASGATADDNTTALSTINNSKYYYIVSAASDATQLGATVSQVGTNAAPTTGIRQRVIGGSIDTLANTNTIATGRNAARAEIVWSEKSPWTPAELAANQAAVVTLFETKPNPKTNFAGFGNDAVTAPYWLVPRPRLDSAIPSRTNIKSALNNGVTPIGVNPNGSTYLVNRITTRSLNGSYNDYRIRDAHKVTICDFFGEDLLAKTALQFAGMRIADDVPEGAQPPGATVVTPRRYRGCVFGLLDVYYNNDRLQNIDAIKAATIVQRETNPRTRLAVRIPLQPIDNAYQFALAIDQVA
jgi:phage tail sheath gpL-like